MVEVLKSYLHGAWHPGAGNGVPLYNPTTEDVLATTSTQDLDFGAALQYARAVGGSALRALSFAERGACLAAASKAVHAHREALIELAIANGGNTRSDAKFDIDGGTGTMMFYASLGRKLGNQSFLQDSPLQALGRAPRFVGAQASVPLRGVSVHLNAFNFPVWGLMEKAAVALLAGVPVITKPATPTALLSYRVMQILVEADVLPPGALQFVAGEPGDILDHVKLGDCVAFTGSSKTGRFVRSLEHLQNASVRVNIEADSLNAAVLGPDVGPDGATFDMFCREVVREMTQKAGQKCTAIRRIFVPVERVDDVVAELRVLLADTVVGNPATRGVKVGPLTNAAQLSSVSAGIDRLRTHTEVLYGGDGRGELRDIDHERGFFVQPTLFLADSPTHSGVHADEIFGPVATVLPYSGNPLDAASHIALGGGGLVASIFSDDVQFCSTVFQEAGAFNGRMYLGSEHIAEHATGHGVALPQLLHGGPGRAGGGSELGGVQGLEFYLQRVALQGAKPMLEKILGN